MQMGKTASDGYLSSCRIYKTFLSRRSSSFYSAEVDVTVSLELVCIVGAAGFLSANGKFKSVNKQMCVAGFVHNIEAQWCKYEKHYTLLQLLTHTGKKTRLQLRIET